MNKHLDILVIEDSEDDAALLIREIKKGGYDPTFVRVETAKDMLACLNEQKWDIIISDYSLPEFNAPEALEVLQETGLDLPFIIISGQVEEEVAVACMTAGAHDFVRKANMARLVPAIERELNDFIIRKEHEKAEIALKESEKLLAAIAENYPNSYVSIIEEDLTVGFSSGKEFKNLNLDPESFVGLTLKEVFGEQTPIVKEHYLETFDGKETSFEFFFNEQHLKFNTVPLFDKNDEIHRILVVVENATEYKRAEESLMESEEKYSSLFKNNHSVMILVDPQNGNIVDANPSACTFYGYSLAELTQKKIQEINLLSDEEVQQEMNRAKLEQRNHFLFRHRLASGKIRDVEVYSGPITVKGKSLLYSIIHDITERKQAKDALQKSEQKLIRAQKIGHIGDWENDIVADKLTWSDELFRIYGFEPTDELKLETAVARMHPDDRDYVKETLAGWAKNGEGKPFEYRVVRPDGSIRHVYSPANVIRDSTGKVVKVYGVTQDITERKQTEETLRLNSLRMDASLKLNQMTKASYSEIADFVLETISLVTKSEYGFVGLMNEDESILIIHSWAKDIMDICEVDEKSVEFPIETAGVWGDAVRDRKVIMINDYYGPKTHKTELPEGHVPLSRILTIPTFENDKIVAVATVANKKTNYDDSDVKQITLLMDGMWKLVQRQKAEEKLENTAEELARSNEELKSLDKMKNEFLSNVSHELKTPLISIQGFTEVMQDELYGPLNDRQKHAMDSVFRNSKRLGRLINSILYLTIQKSGRDKYTMHPINLTEIISNALNDITPQANSKDLTIENNTQSDLPRIKGDMDKLTQVLINLLENATKFTPIGGKITVAAFEDGENIHITVTDDGIGISTKDISNIFERFYQVDASTTRKYGGTGIGLYISKLIVEVHKGKIWAESEEGAGTTFHVVLPK